MRSLRKFACYVGVGLALALFFAIAVFARPNSRVVAQPADGSAAAATTSSPAAAVYQWRTRADEPHRAYLFKAGVQIGGWDFGGEFYLPFNAKQNQWGARCDPPTAPPPPPQALFGVTREKVPNETRYMLHDQYGDHEVSKEIAHQLVCAKLADDSKKLRVTVIGPDEDRNRVVSDLNAKIGDIQEWAIVRDYGPGDWEVKEGFVTTGKPTIYCQSPTGKVLHRQDDYQGGVDRLAEAIRKAKAAYDSKRDPDLRKSFPWLSNIDPMKAGTYSAAAVAGIAGGVWLNRRKAVRA